jgi:antitoxin component of MazEF toxin-antitoxin module
MLLSNFHVMCVDDGWSVGDDMAQPSRVDGGSCPADYVGELTRATLSSAVDGAVARIDGVAYSCEVVDIGKVAGTKAATLGMAVRKHGRTTALTYGTVDSLSLTVNIDYGDGIGVQTLTNQIGIAPDTAQNAHFSEKGDSGSVIMADDRKVVGLLFAGSSDGYTIANQISNVLSELNVTMCTAPTFTLPPKVIKDLSDSKSKEFKVEVKDRKELKAEIKERKELKTEKIEKIEKPEFEKTPREKVRDLPPIDRPPIDRPPIERPPITGPTIDDRLSALEAAVSALSTFVAQSQRPDLSAGAYINEEDLSEEDLEAIRRYAQDQGWM